MTLLGTPSISVDFGPVFWITLGAIVVVYFVYKWFQERSIAKGKLNEIDNDFQTEQNN